MIISKKAKEALEKTIKGYRKKQRILERNKGEKCEWSAVRGLCFKKTSSLGWGVSVCTLCVLFWEKGCTRCPIFRYSNAVKCINTPYFKMADKLIMAKRINATLIKAHKEELNFLIKLNKECEVRK